MLMISTWSFGLWGHEAAWPDLQAGGSSLDAVERACCVLEADGRVDSIGFGGLPDRTGRMTLDGAIMQSPRACGSVAAMSRHLHAVSIARRVMERTGHVMLAGEGADLFADAQGFEPGPLLSDEARAKWQRGDGRQWSGRPVDRGPDRGDAGQLFAGHDTIGVLAIDRAGVLSGACSTSGTPFKEPGRVGDSPIIGHGLYVDPEHGGAVATGLGELIMGVCGSFLAVELMRGGLGPRDALRSVLERIAGGGELRSDDQVAMIAVTPDGRFASAALEPGYRTSITTANRHEAIGPDLVVGRA